MCGVAEEDRVLRFTCGTGSLPVFAVRRARSEAIFISTLRLSNNEHQFGGEKDFLRGPIAGFD
jgi:hypothetical protein